MAAAGATHIELGNRDQTGALAAFAAWRIAVARPSAP